MLKVSATRISSFLRCKQKYAFQYIDRLPKVNNPSFKLGLACHESLELAGNIWMTNETFTKQDYKAILDKYNEVSIREGIEDHSVHLLGRSAVKSRLDNFDIGGKIISLEDKFGPTNSKFPDLVSPLGVPVLGAMDKIVAYDEDTLVVVDYKTSNTVPTPDQLRTDIQLSMYDLVASILYPSYSRIILCLDMLKHSPVYTYRTEEERADFNEYLLEIYNAMMSFTKDQAKPSLNIFCPWCDYRESCQAYIDAYSNSDYKFLPIASYSDAELVGEWEHISKTAKILDERKKELGMFISEKIKSTCEDIKGDSKQLYIRQNARSAYDLQTVASLVPSYDLLGLVSLNKKAVEDYYEKHPSLKAPIMAKMTTNFTSPFIASKSIKPLKKAEQSVVDEEVLAGSDASIND